MRITIRTIYIYFVTFFLLYSSGTPVSNNYSPIMRIGVVVLAVIGIILFSKYAERNVMQHMAILCMWMYISHLVNWTDGMSSIFSLIFIVIGTGLLSQNIDRKDFEIAYTNIMFFLAIISLVITIIQRVMPSIIMAMPTYLGYGVYKNIGFLCYVSLNPLYEMSSYTNASIFREVGVYQFYLLIALCLELSKKERMKKWYLIVYVISILVSASTAGVISLGIIALGWMIKQMKDGSLRRSYVVVILIAVIAVGIYLDRNYIELFDKFYAGSDSNMSLTDRLLTIRSDFNCIILNPMFGLATKATQGSACGITSVAALFGIPYAAVIIYMLYKFVEKMDSNVIGSMTMFLAVFAGLLTQNLIMVPIVMTFLFYGLKADEYEE